MSEIKFNNTDELKVAIELGKIETPRFVSIRHYENKNNEISNYLFNCGVSYKKLLEEDLVIMSFLSPNDFDLNEQEMTVAEQAYNELINSLRKNTSDNIDDHTTMSKAMLNTFEYVAPNIKKHIETGDLYITGLLIKKTVIQAGQYPTRNSRLKTIVKNKMKKIFKTSKYRTFILKNVDTIRLNGKEIIIDRS